MFELQESFEVCSHSFILWRRGQMSRKVKWLTHSDMEIWEQLASRVPGSECFSYSLNKKKSAFPECPIPLPNLVWWEDTPWEQKGWWSLWPPMHISSFVLAGVCAMEHLLPTYSVEVARFHRPVNFTLSLIVMVAKHLPLLEFPNRCARYVVPEIPESLHHCLNPTKSFTSNIPLS